MISMLKTIDEINQITKKNCCTCSREDHSTGKCYVNGYDTDCDIDDDFGKVGVLDCGDYRKDDGIIDQINLYRESVKQNIMAWIEVLDNDLAMNQNNHGYEPINIPAIIQFLRHFFNIAN